MKNLMSMVDFVLEQENKSDSMGNSYWKCLRYAKFLKQHLSLYMFIPCKLVEGVCMVLEEPVKFNNWTNYDYSGTDIGFEDERLCREYQQAKERVLFEGFELIKESCNDTVKMVWDKNRNTIGFGFSKNNNRIIEDLTYLNLELTPNAIKQLGL